MTHPSSKNGYAHFMLKEIYEQPQSLQRLISLMLVSEKVAGQLKIDLPLVDYLKNRFNTISSLHIVACGSAWHAGFIAKYYIESIAKIPVTLDIASEYLYRETLLSKNNMVLLISQSGETADTLSVAKLAKNKGVETIGLVNVPGSPLAREVDYCFLTHAGPEIGIASTKAFTAQVLALYLFAVKIAEIKNLLSPQKLQTLLKGVPHIPHFMQLALSQEQAIQAIAGQMKLKKTFLYIGRGHLFPLCLEGALKLKETSYDHAEGYGAGEIKHGPIAMVDKNVLTFALCPRNSDTYEKTLDIIKEIKSREGTVIGIGLQSDKKLAEDCDQAILLDEIELNLLPLTMAIPLQMFAYHLALIRGNPIDKPRNLAKSVTWA